MSLLRKIDYHRRRRRFSAEELVAAKKSLNDLDDRLAKYLNFTNGFYVEAGANNGVEQSNTFYLEKCFGWKGVLIEAIPETCEKCRRHRRKNHVVNKALVSRHFTGETVRLHYANLMSAVDGALESQDEYIRLGLECQDIAETYAVDVPAATLDSVLASLGELPPIDFFSLDVEGYELEVLEGLQDERFLPRWLLVETFKFDEIREVLGGRYRLVDKLSVHDYLFKRR